MTAIGQVKRAVIAAIAAAGGTAVKRYGEEKFRTCARAVTAVGARETVIETFGRRMTLTLSLDVYAPRELGADGCGEEAEKVTQALTAALPEGLRLRELRWGAAEWDKATGMFRLCASARYAAYFLCERAEDETVFTDFVLKGTVKERE